MDGRPLLLQASQQLAGSGIALMRMGEAGVPEIPAFLHDNVPENGFIGFDSRTISNDFARRIGEKVSEKHIRFAGDEDLVDLVWTDRPALSCEPLWELEPKFAGYTRAEKLEKVREKMNELGADVFVIPALDEIAWLLNLRGGDVLYTPVFLSYLLLERGKATLCVQKEAVSAEIERTSPPTAWRSPLTTIFMRWSPLSRRVRACCSTVSAPTTASRRALAQAWRRSTVPAPFSS